MKFNLQLFGGKGGGSTTTYTPSNEQRALWDLQIATARARQPHEIALNQEGKNFFDKVKNMLDIDGKYYTQGDDHNFVQMGEVAVNRVNEQMVGLSTITTQLKKEVVGGKEQYAHDADGNLIPIFGRNYNDAKDLQTALRGTGETLLASDGKTVIRDNGLTGDLGGYVATAHADLDKGTTYLYEFVEGNSDTGVVGLIKPVGDLVTDVGDAVTTVNGGIDDYDGKFDSAATIASGSVSVAQGKNNSLVGGLSTAINGYNTLQSGKANNSESLLGGLNTSNNSAVTAGRDQL